MADASEPVGTGRLQCFQHRRDAVAEQQIGMPDDCRRSPPGAVETTGARRSQPLYELNLADRAHLLGTIRAVHGARFNEHGGAHVVATAHIVGQLVEQIPLVGNARRAEIPKVVMGIADRQLRLQHGFLGQRQPVIASERHETAPLSAYRMETRLPQPNAPAGLTSSVNCRAARLCGLVGSLRALPRTNTYRPGASWRCAGNAIQLVLPASRPVPASPSQAHSQGGRACAA